MIIKNNIKDFCIIFKAYFKKCQFLTIPYFLVTFIACFLQIRVLHTFGSPPICLLVAILQTVVFSWPMTDGIAIINIGIFVCVSVVMWVVLLILCWLIGIPIIGDFVTFVVSFYVSIQSAKEYDEERRKRRQQKYLM